MSEKEKDLSLCFRCNHRARNLETNGRHQPRVECGDQDRSKWSCYMYQPVRPLVLERNDKGLKEKDLRPLAPGYFSTRFHPVKLADMELALESIDENTVVVYWKRKEEKKDGGEKEE